MDISKVNNLKILNDINDEAYINNNNVLPNVINYNFENSYLSNLNLNNLGYAENPRIKELQLKDNQQEIQFFENINELIILNDFDNIIYPTFFKGCKPNIKNGLMTTITRNIDLYNFEYQLYLKKIANYNLIFKQRLFPYTNNKVDIIYNKYIVQQGNLQIYNTYFQIIGQNIQYSEIENYKNRLFFPLEYNEQDELVICTYYDRNLTNKSYEINLFEEFNKTGIPPILKCIDIDNNYNSAKIIIGYYSYWINNRKLKAQIFNDFTNYNLTRFNNLNQINIGELNDIKKENINSIDYFTISSDSIKVDVSYNDDNPINFKLTKNDIIKAYYKSIKYRSINEFTLEDMSLNTNVDNINISIYNSENKLIDSFDKNYINLKLNSNRYTLENTFDYILNYNDVIKFKNDKDISFINNYNDLSFQFNNIKNINDYDNNLFILNVINDQPKYINDIIINNVNSYEDSLQNIITLNNINLINNYGKKMIKITNLEEYDEAYVENFIDFRDLGKRCFPTIKQSSDIVHIGYYWYPLLKNSVDIYSSYIIKNFYKLFNINGDLYHTKLINYNISNNTSIDISNTINNTFFRGFNYYEKQFLSKINFIPKSKPILELEYGILKYRTGSIFAFCPFFEKININDPRWINIISNDMLLIKHYNSENDNSYNYIPNTFFNDVDIKTININYFTNKINIISDKKTYIIENINYETYMKDVLLHNDSGILSINFNNQNILRTIYHSMYGQYWNVYTSIINKDTDNIKLNLKKENIVGITYQGEYNTYKLGDLNNIKYLNTINDNFNDLSNNYQFKIYPESKNIINDNSINTFRLFTNNNNQYEFITPSNNYRINSKEFKKSRSLFYNINDLIINLNDRKNDISKNLVYDLDISNIIIELNDKTKTYIQSFNIIPNYNTINDNYKLNNGFSFGINDIIIFSEEYGHIKYLDSTLNNLYELYPNDIIIIKNICAFKNCLETRFNYYDINRETPLFNTTKDLTIENILNNLGVNITNNTPITIYRKGQSTDIINQLSNINQYDIKLETSYDISINSVIYSNNDLNKVKDYSKYNNFEKNGKFVLKKQKIQLIDGDFENFRRNNFEIKLYEDILLSYNTLLINSSNIFSTNILSIYDNSNQNFKTLNINDVTENDLINIGIIYDNKYYNGWFKNILYLDGEIINGNLYSNSIIVNKSNLNFQNYKVYDINFNEHTSLNPLNINHLIEVLYGNEKYYIKNIRNDMLNIHDYILSDSNFDKDTMINIKYLNSGNVIDLSFYNKQLADFIPNNVIGKETMEKIFSDENTIMPPIYFSFIN